MLSTSSFDISICIIRASFSWDTNTSDTYSGYGLTLRELAQIYLLNIIAGSSSNADSIINHSIH